MARLLLIRHAPTPETGSKLTGRLPGVGLGEAGREAARRTSDRLADLRLAAVYSSPMERTWETAEIVAEPHRLRPVAEEGLLEVDYGRWAGRTLKSLSKLKSWWTVQVTPSRMIFPDGEGLADAQRRAVECCERLAARHGNNSVALVSHSDIIKAVVSHYLGQPFDLFQRIVISTASVTVIDMPRRGIPLVVAVNATGAEGSWR